MRVVIQRVTHAKVKINGRIKSKINDGIIVYAAIIDSDTPQIIEKMAAKILNLRIFDDETGKMNLSLTQKNYECLLISQFTLYADCSKGNRPFYGNASKPAHAIKMLSLMESILKQSCKCETGEFGANMQIEYCNSGPVTIILDL
ncbi:MAG: hypothetical protein ACD_79C00263G0003 [uncultured bacterium]|nr:MAG: hypothetical protein ACD_79C00263G0003 [uncultured bacterium]